MATGTSAVMVGTPPEDATGAVRFGPTGTPLPATATGALDAGLLKGGYISQDGLTETIEADVETIRAWGTDPVAQVQPEHNYSFAFTLYETLNADVLRAVYGADNVTVDATTGEIAVDIVPGVPAEMAFVFEIFDRNKGHVRIVVPKGQLVFSGDITYNDEGVAGFTVTVTALANGGQAKATKRIAPVA